MERGRVRRYRGHFGEIHRVISQRAGFGSSELAAFATLQRGERCADDLVGALPPAVDSPPAVVVAVDHQSGRSGISDRPRASGRTPSTWCSWMRFSSKPSRDPAM